MLLVSLYISITLKNGVGKPAACIYTLQKWTPNGKAICWKVARRQRRSKKTIVACVSPLMEDSKPGYACLGPSSFSSAPSDMSTRRFHGEIPKWCRELTVADAGSSRSTTRQTFSKTKVLHPWHGLPLCRCSSCLLLVHR